mmetsp:Transcript_61944/g.192407  ORF Transcript_61944/g.192407 Transcript_61944/m.192407 type:complete len:282 (-) Transcript_61944:48-893(-)
MEGKEEDSAAGGGSSSGEDSAPAPGATAAELEAEVHRQSEVLEELFPELRRGRGPGAPAKGRGTQGAGRGRGGLLVSRFQPAPAAKARPAPEPQEPPQQKRRRAPKAELKVDPRFARVFKGGPRRKEADLPEQEDEGRQEAPAASEEARGGAPPDWLTSLGAEGAAVGEDAGAAAEAPTGAPGLDWLTSLTGARPAAPATQGVLPDAVGAGRLSAAARAYVGKALPIPPFWRTSTEEQLEQKFLNECSSQLERLRRMAKDSRRVAAKRGRLRVKPQHATPQ